MIQELKTFIISCYECGREETVQAKFKADINLKNINYHELTEGPCGMTNYYRDIIVCNKCYKKRIKND